MKAITKEQYTALKNVQEYLHEVTVEKKERYILHTTDENGTRPEIVSRGEFLEFVVNYVSEQLLMFEVD